MPRIFAFLFLFLFLSNLYAGDNFKKVCIKDICLEAEVVDSFKTRERGLMFREGLGADQGMLFVFTAEEIHIFWMKNMRFPLDIVWIDAYKNIVEIKERVPICTKTCESISPLQKSKYVLEVNAGFLRKNGIKVGDRVRF